MTISADEAKALLDAATAGPWIVHAGPKGRTADYVTDAEDIEVAEFCEPPDARLIAAAPDLAATVIELSERIDKVEAERDKLSVRRDELDVQCWAHREKNEALQARIDKVLALHRKTTEEMLDHKCANEDCEHDDECPSTLVDVCSCCTEIAWQVSDEYWPAAMSKIIWPCPTVLALTQGGEQ